MLAAQRAESRRPYVKAVFDDYDGDRARLRFARYYTGVEAESYVGCCIAPDGSLVRTRVAAGNVYVSRVAAPGPGSDYTSWTALAAAAAAGVALSVAGTALVLFFVHTDGLTIKFSVSFDNGASWGAPATLLAAAAAVAFLAAAYEPTGARFRLLWNEGATVCWSGEGALNVRHVWTNTIASCVGLSVTYQGDWCVAICGTQVTTGDAKVWTCLLGDGLNQALDTWSALREVHTATAGSGVSYFYSAVVYGAAAWRLWFLEGYTGSLGYYRQQWATMSGLEDFAQELWREPQAFDFAGVTVLSSAVSASGVWLVSSPSVWYAASPAAASYDASADVVEVDVDLERYQGKVRLVLENSAGRYAAAAAGGLAIAPGRRLALSFGYWGAAGLETSDGPGYWVEAVERRHERDGSARVEVTAFDAWHYLAAWRARHQFVWAAGAKNVSQLVTFLFARAGLDYASLSSSSTFANLYPAFTVHAGESGLAAVRRLLEKVPDVVIMRSGAGRTVYPQASDASAYSYGGAHAIGAAKYRAAAAAVNRARAFGVSLFDERFDFADIEASGERIAQVLDLALTTTALAGDRASFMLRAAAYGEISDELVAPLNAGQELYDVVDLTDAGAGLSGAKRRVLSCVFRWSAWKPRAPCEVELGLGAV